MEAWKSKIIEDIKTYVQGMEAEHVVQARLRLIEHELTRIGSGYKSVEIVKDGNSHREDRLCDLLDRKEALLDKLNTGREYRKITKQCLDKLDEEERYILMEMCNAEYGDGTAIRLGMKLNMDERSVRRYWHKAMTHYQRIESGCPIK